MRILAILAATAVVALAGCGGEDDNDSGSAGTTSTARGYGDEAATVALVMKDYFAALASGDGAKVCAFFTDDAVEKIESAGGGCQETVTAGVEGTGTKAYEDPAIDTPEVDGSTATVHYALTVEGAEVEADQTLTKVDGEWKLEAATPPGG